MDEHLDYRKPIAVRFVDAPYRAVQSVYVEVFGMEAEKAGKSRRKQILLLAELDEFASRQGLWAKALVVEALNHESQIVLCQQDKTGFDLESTEGFRHIAAYAGLASVLNKVRLSENALGNQ